MQSIVLYMCRAPAKDHHCSVYSDQTRPDQTTPRNDAGVSIIVITVAPFQIVVVRITILTMGKSTRISIVMVIFVKVKKSMVRTLNPKP